MEIRIESVNKDNSHSWVRISRGLNKLVTDLIDKEYDDEQETSTTKTDVFAFGSRSKAKARPRRPPTACSSSRTVPIFERIWIDIEPGAQSSLAYPVAKRLNTLLRHGQLRRRKQQEKISILYWFVRTRNSLSPSSSRSFRTQSHWSHTAGQCINSKRFLRVHLSFWMCSQFTLHHEFRIDTRRTQFWAKDRRYSSRLWILSCPMCNQFAFYHQFWINTWRSKFEQQTDSILSACGSHGQESQGSWYDRFECTAPCTIHA